MARRLISSASDRERRIGYSRAMVWSEATAPLRR